MQRSLRATSIAPSRRLFRRNAGTGPRVAVGAFWAAQQAAQHPRPSRRQHTQRSFATMAKFSFVSKFSFSRTSDPPIAHNRQVNVHPATWQGLRPRRRRGAACFGRTSWSCWLAMSRYVHLCNQSVSGGAQKKAKTKQRRDLAVHHFTLHVLKPSVIRAVKITPSRSRKACGLEHGRTGLQEGIVAFSILMVQPV